jgi:hypothetical protein
VTIFARSLCSLSRRRTARTRGWSLAGALVAGLWLALLLMPASADALVTEAAGVKVGLQPRSAELVLAEEGSTFANANGNVVLHGSSDYAIYWDPKKPTEFTSEWLVNLDGFFQALGETQDDTPFGVLNQYRDRSNAVAPFQALFKGSYSDTTKFPTSKCSDPGHLEVCLTDAQLREQLLSFIATHDLPKGIGTVYYLLTPPHVAICLNEAATSCSDYALSSAEEKNGERKSTSYKESFCSYHSDINSDGAAEGDASTVLYVAIPWIAYPTAWDCQDGGWNPEKHEEHREAPKEMTKTEAEAQEKALLEDPPKKLEEEELRIALEGPHIQEPNQEEKNESSSIFAALSDVLVNQIAEEEMNTVTDPLLDSWQTPKGKEATDICRDVFAGTAGENGSDGEIAGAVAANPRTFAGTLSNVTVGPGRYYINNVYNRAGGGCDGGLGLIARFTVPNPVNVGEIIGVDGMESSVSLLEGDAFGPFGPPTLTFATFSWNFGDGTPEVAGFAPGAPTCEAPWLSPCAASAFHVYQYGGKYKITLTITDVGGNKTNVTHEIAVNGPPPPTSSSSAAGQSAASSSSSSSSSGGTQGKGGSTAIPAPVAAAAIVRQSLHTALRKGLVVSYSVNEQVAGHFEVLLSSALAHRLGIAGTTATGLPAGSAPQLVIAKAILVTTKGGHSAVHIVFSKRTAARLARVQKLPLMLRLTVRNATAGAPQTTTVLSSVTLGG